MPVAGAARHLLGAAGGLALLFWIYWANLVHFSFAWTTDDNYSHGFLVPLISLYFANLAARRGPVRVRSGVGLGIALLTVAVLGRLGHGPGARPVRGRLHVPARDRGSVALLFGTVACGATGSRSSS